MRRQYVWEVKAVVWEDRCAMRRTFHVPGPDIWSVLDQLERMDTDFRNARIESIKLAKQYFGGTH